MARVLIVEDEQTDQTILGRIVEGAGHEVYLASGGAEALDVYMGRSIDVIVTDLHMPGIEGLELIVALQALFPDVAIIAVSAMGPELLAAAKDKGALVAFSKPVDPQELLEAIAHAGLRENRPLVHDATLDRPPGRTTLESPADGPSTVADSRE